METVDIIGIHVSAINLNLACRAMEEWIRSRQKIYACVVPVSTVVECQNDQDYKEVVNGADMATPDGMPMVLLGKLKGHKNMARTYGPDLMLDFCKISQEKGYTHYFYGATADTLRLLEVKLKEKFPRLSIVGKYSPPFCALPENEDKEIVEEINRRNPDVLWVGLGSPKQDFWMRAHRERLNVPVMIGVGAAFDFVAGTKPQAPRWMRGLGLEWFFRLCCEPRRLWRRYLIGNTKFIYFLLRDMLVAK